MVISIDSVLIKQLVTIECHSCNYYCHFYSADSVILTRITTSPFLKLKVSHGNYCRTLYTQKNHSCSPSLGGGIPLLTLADVLRFCFTEGTVGMASTVLVAGLLGTTCLGMEDG